MSMNKIEELEFLKLLMGKAGPYSDSAIIVDCRMFDLKKAVHDTTIKIISTEISIRPQGISKEKQALTILKNILEKSKLSSKIERLIIDTIEEEIKVETVALRNEIRGLLGIKEEQDFNEPGEGGDTV